MNAKTYNTIKQIVREINSKYLLDEDKRFDEYIDLVHALVSGLITKYNDIPLLILILASEYFENKEIIEKITVTLNDGKIPRVNYTIYDAKSQ